MSRPRVIIDLVPIRPGRGGTGSGIWTHALRLVQELDRLAPGDLDVQVLINPEQRAFFGGLRHVRARSQAGLWSRGPFRLLWVHGALPLLCLLLRARVLHKVATETPLLSPARRVTTVHDFFNEVMRESGAAPSDAAARYFSWAARVCFARSRVVITVSEAVRQEALARFPRSRAELVAIHNGADLPQGLPPRPADGRFNILCVAKLMPYKGQLEAIEALTALLAMEPALGGRVRLVLHGFSNDEAYRQRLLARIAQLPPGAAELRPYGQRASLHQIYAGADAFLFLTRYEGFGLPVVEAQALGVPVVCSDLPVLREVGGEGALYVDRSDARCVAAALLTVMRDPAARQRLIAAGHANAQRFSWAAMAQRTADAYRRAAR
ncbi:MAG: glycosyltransferase family 4 protein [Flavobacteriales bacterium]